MIQLEINNCVYEVPNNLTLLQACTRVGISIPTLCYDERLEPEGYCELCLVELAGENKMVLSCQTKVKPGMKVVTHSPQVTKARQQVLTNLLLELKHPQDCLNCLKTDSCRLRAYCQEYNVPHPVIQSAKEKYPVDDTNPFYYIDPNKCILCNLCIRVCAELQVRGALEINEKGYIARKNPKQDSEKTVLCESCGNCLDVCPTGAIGSRIFRDEFAAELTTLEEKVRAIEELRHVKTTCPYCGVGCQMELVVSGQKIVDVRPVNTLPNTGLLCVKGRFGYKFVNHPDRLQTPLIKKDGKFVKATWNEAYRLIVGKASEIKNKYGSQAFGGLSSARCTNTERRVQRVRQAIEPVGASKPDWQILMELMNLLGIDQKYSHPSEIMAEIASLTPEYAGITYDKLEDVGIQWPCYDKEHPGTPYLHKDKFDRGKAIFVAVDNISSAEAADEEYPFIMTTGRVLFQYHSMTMTGRVDELNKKAPSSFIEINTKTAERLGLKDNDNVRITSRRGSIVTTAKITDKIDEQVLFVPFHYTNAKVNYLTNPQVDPLAKIPELKVAAVKIEKV